MLAYAFDPAGNLVERLPGTDPNSAYTDYVSDTAVYDSYGRLQADVDANTGQEYTASDPVGFGEQFGLWLCHGQGRRFFCSNMHCVKRCLVLESLVAGVSSRIVWRSSAWYSSI